MRTVGNYPALSASEFARLCWLAHNAFDDLPNDKRRDWVSVEILRSKAGALLRLGIDKLERSDIDAPEDEQLVLKVTREIVVPTDDDRPLRTDGNGMDDMVSEPEDAELLQPMSHSSTPATSTRYRIVYDILLSPTYTVPVLYFSIIDTQASSPMTTMSTVQSLLSPPQYHPQLRQTGDNSDEISPLGSLTLTTHPVTGAPVFFIHPCLTFDALAEIAEGCSGGEATLDTYLGLWLGVVGGAVGLHLPVGMVAKPGERDGKEVVA